MILGSVAIAVYAGGVGYSGFFQARASRSFDRLVVEKVSAAPVAAETFSSAGALLGRMRIPTIGLSVIVVEGTGEAALLKGVGHIEGTAPLGWPSGNVGIAGHRDSYFRGLQRISRNDSIFVETVEGEHEYHVDDIRIVDPDATDVLAASSDGLLTLVTCYPFGYVGSAPRRFVVRASLRSVSPV